MNSANSHTFNADEADRPLACSRRRTVKTAWIVFGLVSVLAGRSFGESVQSDISAEIHSLQMQLNQLRESVGIDSPMPEPRKFRNASISQPQPWQMQPPRQQREPISLPKSDKYPNARLTGFTQADTGWFHQSAGNLAAVGDIQDGADFRRARLAATGDAWDNVSYLLELDFATPGRPNFMDVWLELKDMADGNIRIGQFRHPIGMDGLTSVKELPFFERGLPFAFLPFRQIGAMYSVQSDDEDHTWAISGFRFPTDAYGGNVGDNGGYGMATRLTSLLVDNGDNGVIHVGGGFSFADPANDRLRYRNQPEFFVAETGGAGLVPVGVQTNVPAFVDTGLISTSSFNLANAELGVSEGSFHAQSEIFFANVNQIGGPSLTFPGAYIHAGYILTGESRPYSRKAGAFGRVVPENPFGSSGGRGAWEVAGRWSFIDLNDANILGGRLNDVTLGLNWYLNKFTKFQFNYIHAFLGSSSAATGPLVNGSSADIFAFRAQVDF